MPDPKDNTGRDRDAPEVEGRRGPPARPGAESAQDDRALEDEARPGKGENQAGFLKDTDAG